MSRNFLSTEQVLEVGERLKVLYRENPHRTMPRFAELLAKSCNFAVTPANVRRLMRAIGLEPRGQGQQSPERTVGEKAIGRGHYEVSGRVLLGHMLKIEGMLRDIQEVIDNKLT